MDEPTIRRLERADFHEWARLRVGLWPDDDMSDHIAQMEAIRGNEAAAVFVAERPDGGLCGFLEITLRGHAEGCRGSPVAYLEGWFVDPDYRQHGVGRRMVAAAERWAFEHDCREVASDAYIDDRVSLDVHQHLGFEECGRLVHFRKEL